MKNNGISTNTKMRVYTAPYCVEMKNLLSLEPKKLRMLNVPSFNKILCNLNLGTSKIFLGSSKFAIELNVPFHRLIFIKLIFLMSTAWFKIKLVLNQPFHRANRNSTAVSNRDRIYSSAYCRIRFKFNCILRNLKLIVPCSIHSFM